MPEQRASGGTDFQGLLDFETSERRALPVIIFRIGKQSGQILPEVTRT
jgi:hypothetical protein